MCCQPAQGQCIFCSTCGRSRVWLVKAKKNKRRSVEAKIMGDALSQAVSATPRANARRLNRSLARTGLALVTGLFLSACAGQMNFPTSDSGQEDLASQGINVIRMTTDNIGQYNSAPGSVSSGVASANPPRDPSPYTYRVGPGDKLRIQTWTSPERNAALDDLEVAEGTIVDENGRIYYPFIGGLPVRNKTVGQIREDLNEQLRRFIAEPQVEVAVQEFNAHHATLLGSVSSPGQVTLTNVPTRLLDLVNGGATDESDLRQVEIRRGQSTYRVNLESFIRSGARGQNPIILPSDVVYVPPIADNKVFTFGEVGTGEMALSAGGMSLTEVLANVGGIDRIRADARGVFVFRRTAATPQGGFDVFQFDLREATTLVLTTDFAMAPLDIVFVTSDPITRWNDTVTKLISPFAGFLQVRQVGQSVN